MTTLTILIVIIFTTIVSSLSMFVFRYTIYEGPGYGSFVDGAWNGMVGMVVRGVCSTLGSFHTKYDDSEHCQAIDKVPMQAIATAFVWPF